MISSFAAEAFLGRTGINRRDFELSSAKSILDPGDNVLTYIYKDDPAYLARLEGFGQDTLAILSADLQEAATDITDKMLIFSPTPKLDFVRLLKRFFVPAPVGDRIHPTAIIHPQAEIDATARIGANCRIGNCRIGADSILEENVTLADKVHLGNKVHIRSNCCIGAEDFGPVRLEDNSVMMFPQLGGVIIEDEVEIFSSTIVGRGTLANTIIKRGVKIDMMCQIGHNTTIGENTVITVGSIILGSAWIGRNSYIGAHSIIRNECSLGDTVLVGMGSVVTKSFPDNVVLIGSPARIIRENPEPFKF